MKRLSTLAALLLATTAAPALATDAAPTSACSTPVAPVVMAHISICDIGKRDAPVLVLVPGLASPRAVWDGVVPTLAATHRLLVVQVNGFGGEAPGGNLKPGILDGIVADLDAYLAKNKLSGVAMAGHSMGGLIGLMLAKGHPGDLGKLMIVDSLPFYGMVFGPQASVAMVAPRGAAMRDAIVASYGKPADPATAERTANFLAQTPAARASVKAWALAADPRVTGQAMYEDLTTDLRPDLAAIATPLTVVYAWNAATLPKDRADALYHGAYAAAPTVRYVPVGDAAHFVMLDQPAAFAAALGAFLRDR